MRYLLSLLLIASMFSMIQPDCMAQQSKNQNKQSEKVQNSAKSIRQNM